MTKEFFGNQVDRLRKVYSPASLNEERVEIMWAEFKHVNGDRFEQALNKLIGEYTTSALPAMSRFREAISEIRKSGPEASSMQEFESAFGCEPCRDFGWTFSGHTVVRCEICYRGKQVPHKDLLKHQASYDRGRKIFRSPFDKEAVAPSGERIFPKLPYDPQQRGEVDRSGEWA